MRWLLGLLLTAVLLTAALSLRGGRPELRIATTTSLYDTGLLDYLAKRYDRRLAFLPLGTGQALDAAKRGEADLLLTHAPSLEREFVEEGWGKNRVVFAYSSFIIVGPPGDPAGIENLPPLEALRRIALAGREGRAKWVSRGDLSGTHVRENLLWTEAGFDPGDLRKEDWYLEAGAGMGKTLLLASERGAYTLSDLGTFLKYQRKGLVRLRLMVEGGGELLNVYSAIPVNPERVRGVNLREAVRFVTFLLSEEGRRLIGEFGREEYGSPLFFPATENGLAGWSECST